MKFFQGSDGGKDAIKTMKRVYKYIQNIPEAELKEITYNYPELAEQIKDIQLGKSNLEDIQDNPKFQAKIMDTMNLLQERAEGKETQAEQIAREKDQESAIATGQAERRNMLADLERRGMSDSGAALQSLIAGTQGSANRARETSRDRILGNRQRADQATMQLGNLASQQQAQEFGRRSQIGQAMDARQMAQAQMDRQSNMANTQAQQAWLNNKTMIGNKNLEQANLMAQQRYNNAMAKAGAMSGAAANLAKTQAEYGSSPSGFESAVYGGLNAYIASGGNPMAAGAGAVAGGWGKAEDGGVIYAEDGISGARTLQEQKVLDDLNNRYGPSILQKTPDQMNNDLQIDTSKASLDNFNSIRNTNSPVNETQKEETDNKDSRMKALKSIRDTMTNNMSKESKDREISYQPINPQIQNILSPLQNEFQLEDGGTTMDGLKSIRDTMKQNISRSTDGDIEYQEVNPQIQNILSPSQETFQLENGGITSLKDLLKYQGDSEQIASINEQASSPHQAPAPTPTQDMPPMPPQGGPMQPPMDPMMAQQGMMPPPQGMPPQMPPQGAPVPVEDGGVLHAANGALAGMPTSRGSRRDLGRLQTWGPDSFKHWFDNKPKPMPIGNRPTIPFDNKPKPAPYSRLQDLLGYSQPPNQMHDMRARLPQPIQRPEWFGVSIPDKNIGRPPMDRPYGGFLGGRQPLEQQQPPKGMSAVLGGTNQSSPSTSRMGVLQGQSSQKRPPIGGGLFGRLKREEGGLIYSQDGLDPNEIYDLEDKYNNIENDLSDPYGHPEMDSIDNDMKVEDEENRMADEANYENGGSFNPEIFLKNQEASKRYQNGGTYRMADGDLTFASDGSGDVVAGDSFERDRVDARLNSGEAVLNVAQQQRLMDLLRGKISLDELGDDDIVEGVPRDYQDDLTSILDMGMSPSEDEKDEEDEDVDIKGLRRLIKMLGKEE